MISGIGEGRTKGRYAIPYALQSIEGQTIAGVTTSHEIEGASHPILLSIEMQGKLGLVKDIRAGTIKLRDYPDERLEIVRQKGTGLFMVRIDHLNPYTLLKYPTLPRGILQHQWQENIVVEQKTNAENKQKHNKRDKIAIAMMG